MSAFHNCTGCGVKVITWRFAICTDCEAIYGNTASEWPDWLRESWNMEQRERRRNRKANHFEVHFTDLEKDDDD